MHASGSLPHRGRAASSSALLTHARRGGREGAPAPPAAPAPASEYLSLSDPDLLRQCRVDVYRASGPGGQHRNKTDSAVRITHEPTRTVAIANESRSQHTNKSHALRRLRQKIALSVASVDAGAGAGADADTDAEDDGSVGRARAGGAEAGAVPADGGAAAGGDVQPIDVPADLAAILPYDAKGHRNKRQLGRKHADYSKGVALLLGLFQESGYSISIVAKKLSMSTGALSKIVVSDKQLAGAINRMRASVNLRPLKR